MLVKFQERGLAALSDYLLLIKFNAVYSLTSKRRQVKELITG